MEKRILGKNGLTVSEIGMGCMTVGKDYSNESKTQAIKIIRRAYDLGITMFDTAELYGGYGRNESLVGEALAPIRDKVIIATKCGVKFEGGHMLINSRPDEIRRAVEGSLKRLQTDYIDLYYTHRVDPKVPIETVAETMAKLHEEGKILNWGISEPCMETLKKANAVFPVAAIESEYNMMWREPEEEILPVLEEMGIGFVPYRPLARGFLSDASDAMFLKAAENTRFDGENLEKNMVLKNKLMEIAKSKGISAAQFALAWLLHQKQFIAPIPGVSRMETMDDNVKAAEVKFTREELNEIGKILSSIEIAGERYDPNSENGQSVRK